MSRLCILLRRQGGPNSRLARRCATMRSCSICQFVVLAVDMSRSRYLLRRQLLSLALVVGDLLCVFVCFFRFAEAGEEVLDGINEFA